MRRVRPHELGKVVGRAEQLELTRPVGGRVGAAVDEADDVEAVFRVLADLAVEELRHVPRADDDHVLDVGRVTSADDAGGRSEERDEHDRCQPEDDEPRHRRVRQAGEMRDREEGPGSDRDDLEDAEDVVHRGVIAPLLVPVVEGMCSREKHPQREAGDEERDFPPNVDPVGNRRGRTDCEGEQERRHEPDDVGREEEAPHEPAPRHVDRRVAERAHDRRPALLARSEQSPLVGQYSPQPSVHAQGLIPRANSSFPDGSTVVPRGCRLEGQTGDSVLSGAGFRTFSQEAALEPRPVPHRYWEREHHRRRDPRRLARSARSEGSSSKRTQLRTTLDVSAATQRGLRSPVA